MNQNARRFRTLLGRFELVAILRGISPPEAVPVARSLADAGFRLIEVPLNSPQPLDSIRALVPELPDAMVGAGTVLEPGQVHDVHAAGGQLVVAPNFRRDVVAEAARLGLACVPGVATPSEAFAALDAGATALKLFPAEMIPPAAVKAIRAVLPAGVLLLPVGGIGTGNMAAYRAAGASGFGVGSALYQPGLDAAEVLARAQAFAAACAGTIRT